MNSAETPSAMYDQLVAKIVEAVPDVNDWYCPRCEETVDGSRVTFQEEHMDCGSRVASGRSPNLEDVLRLLSIVMMYPEIGFALNEKLNLTVWETIDRQRATMHCEWHLGHDLAWHRDNAPETITFLHSLLCNAN